MGFFGADGGRLVLLYAALAVMVVVPREVRPHDAQCAFVGTPPSAGTTQPGKLGRAAA